MESLTARNSASAGASAALACEPVPAPAQTGDTADQPTKPRRARPRWRLNDWQRAVILAAERRNLGMPDPEEFGACRSWRQVERLLDETHVDDVFRWAFRELDELEPEEADEAVSRIQSGIEDLYAVLAAIWQSTAGEEQEEAA